MELAVTNNTLKSNFLNLKAKTSLQNPNLTEAELNLPFLIRGIETDDQGLKDFLFTLGCFEGETVTVISVLAENYVINVKDARYSIDKDLAKAILV